MDRLFRPQYLTVALLMAVCLAVMVLVLPRFPDKVLNIPLWILIISEYGFALIVSICAQLKSIRQSFLNLRLAPGLICLSVAFLIAAISVMFSPINAWGPEGSISIGLMQLTILNLAILFSVFTITTQSHPEFEGTLSHAEANTSDKTNIKRLSKMRTRAGQNKEVIQDEPVVKQSSMSLSSESGLDSVDSPIEDPRLGNFKQAGPVSNISPYQNLVNRMTQNSKALENKLPIQTGSAKPRQSSTREAVDIAKVEKLLTPPSSSISQNQKPITKELSPEINRLPSVNSSKSQNKGDQSKRPINSAITKLQALSASGTGASHTTHAGVDTSDLRSVLDRLDLDSDDEAEAAQVKDKEERGIFKNNVDSEVENIFAGMVPAEAQREIIKDLADSDLSTAPEVKVEVSKEEFLFESKTEYPEKSREEKGIFKRNIDSEIEDIFSGMVSAEAQREITRGQSAPVLSPASDKSELEPRLFKDNVDDQVDKIFSTIVSVEAQKEVDKSKLGEEHKAGVSNDDITGDRSPVVTGFDNLVADSKSLIPEINDFGRLSSRASAENESATQVGTMKTIGKLLIDSDAVEALIKKGESGKITINLPSAKVISQIRGQGIESLLRAIDSFDGVDGSMLVGEDGLVISSTLATTIDRDGTGVLAHGMLANSNIGTQKLDLGELEQMILVTNTKEDKATKQKTTVFTDVDAGVLAVFLHGSTITGLDNLIEKITTIAKG